MYEWDEDKRVTNLAKHHIDFNMVVDFDWSVAVVEPDLRYNYGEERFRAFGRINGICHAMIFTFRGSKVRVISLRPMHDKEIKRYGL